MAGLSISTTIEGMPPTRAYRARAAAPRPRFIEAWVVRADGRSAVELVAENTPAGRASLDRWATERLAHACVDYIAVYPVGRIAQAAR
jgi:hypothetical protein